MGNLQPLVAQTLLPGAKEVYGQLLLLDSNQLEKQPFTAYGQVLQYNIYSGAISLMKINIAILNRNQAVRIKPIQLPIIPVAEEKELNLSSLRKKLLFHAQPTHLTACNY